MRLRLKIVRYNFIYSSIVVIYRSMYIGVCIIVAIYKICGILLL